MKLIIDINDEMVCNDIKNKALEPTSATDEVIINVLYNGTPYHPQGEWKFISMGLTYKYQCSLCGRTISTTPMFLADYPFCHCGADMRKGSQKG